MATLIDGKAVSRKLREEIKMRVDKLAERNIGVSLAVILVGDDPASQVYVSNKEKACAEVGIRSNTYRLPKETTEEELLALIGKLNADQNVNAILVQLPLPQHIDTDAVLTAIAPDKDADAFHPENVGKIMNGTAEFLPCTPAGILALLDDYGIDPKGKHCVIVGRSGIVGKPLAMMLLGRDATVTVTHSKTLTLENHTARADILIVATGKRGLIGREMVKPGAVVIDVGMNRTDDHKLCGDVLFDEVSEVASAITPVPGGVGPMTITMLLNNTVTAACKQAGIKE